MAFRDIITIVIQAGKGGDGCMSMRRLKYIPKGGPDGGEGGRGGSVYLEAITDVTSLDRLVGKRVFKAKSGDNGSGRNKNGRKADDITIYVPVGTIARDSDTGELLADLIEVGERVCVAKGGVGGRGNASFATSRRQMPRFAEYGTSGDKRRLVLELRSIADVGLVGYPNAGKSSLLASLSNATPEIASYPFTTLTPNLGVIEQNMQRFTLADIPGIIDGASEGKGLGFEFLRHISRTRLLAYVLDIAEEPAENLKALQKEVENYDPHLFAKQGIIILNKIDLAEAEEVEEIVDELSSFGLPIVAISTQEGTGLEDLKTLVFDLLPEVAPLEPMPKEVVEVKVEPIKVVKVESEEQGYDNEDNEEDGEDDDASSSWLVTGEEVERVISRFDTRNADAVSYLHHHFMSLGVNKLLKRAGAKNGDDVIIAESVFEYFDEEGHR